MLTYCLKCKENTKNIDSKMVETNGRLMLSSRFTKEQEAEGLLNNLGNKTPLSKIQLLGDISF